MKMKKVSYWVAECLNDGKCYSIRAKTKKEVIQELKKLNVVKRRMDQKNFEWSNDDYRFSNPIRKVTVFYKDAFDLICQCHQEGGLYESQYVI